MRTRKSTASFKHPFTLNPSVGELPAGTYEIEIDEEEIITANTGGYRRTAVYFYVQAGTSTRTLVITPGEFESALERDRIGPSSSS